MTYLETLTEALATFLYDELPDDPSSIDLDAYKVVADAARAYRDLLANGQQVEWCETHDQVAWLADPGGYCRVGWEDGAHKDCLIGSRLLTDPPIPVREKKPDNPIRCNICGRPEGGHKWDCTAW